MQSFSYFSQSTSFKEEEKKKALEIYVCRHLNEGPMVFSNRTPLFKECNSLWYSYMNRSRQKQ